MKIRLNQAAMAGAVVLAGALLTGGCKTTVNSVERAQPSAQKEMVADKRILTDASLARKVYIVGVNEARNDSGVLQIQLEVANQTRTRQRVTYHVQWFDAAGMQVSSTTGAILPCVLEGKETRFISAVAPHPACKDFRVQFMESTR